MRSEHCGELLGDVRGTVEGTVYMCKLQRPTSESDYWRQSLCLSAGAVMSQSPGVERLTRHRRHFFAVASGSSTGAFRVPIPAPSTTTPGPGPGRDTDPGKSVSPGRGEPPDGRSPRPRPGMQRHSQGPAAG